MATPRSSRFASVASVVAIAAFAAWSVAAAPAAGGARAGQVSEHDFVGADRCRTCHAEEYRIWEQSPHARAFAVLSSKEQQDPRCLSCHTLVSQDTQPALVGVQCESCHGAGKHYAVEYVMRDAELSSLLQLASVDGKTCARCHTDASPSLSTFSYEQKRELIKHWK